MFTSLRFLCFGNNPLLPSLSSGPTTSRPLEPTSVSEIGDKETTSSNSKATSPGDTYTLSSSKSPRDHPIPSPLMRQVEAIRPYILQQRKKSISKSNLKLTSKSISKPKSSRRRFKPTPDVCHYPEDQQVDSNNIPSSHNSSLPMISSTESCTFSSLTPSTSTEIPPPITEILPYENITAYVDDTSVYEVNITKPYHPEEPEDTIFDYYSQDYEPRAQSIDYNQYAYSRLGDEYRFEPFNDTYSYHSLETSNSKEWCYEGISYNDSEIVSEERDLVRSRPDENEDEMWWFGILGSNVNFARARSGDYRVFSKMGGDCVIL